ncbi:MULTISPECIES: beta-ketoacyl-[acyl-carrier-protein] synthase family protein [Tenebrionibacter/Tenebrionicola group]|jgi:3-oxoacyl-[acyl-carrier-protein] synthase II|uniref:Beta-ketoacyl-[acyl-carrier-protein] synthase family protein n=2 Tax=Tenebrionibacter/Tenebrionicola group TaxID=2969848 RepID=A0A8K0V4P2_9ENTR|nr:MULTISPECIES: beta-ketoacyl-[acyl-carrier-protein] synthase family protein [Tenebrionibacter/Tenebrionicola group]MBK4715085.1 beta-ketoacyl-[acyl-carrier-protein] synthase family protein [Tenebrionibacter intestinalis]MBV4414041.1 beta-ketoacyl-[acyl-carrier-protein] synthase family protein [Tenebrionicola larvae]MBV5096255.1 beta-ketoacyl-[acyl-carrier-protein] synthase family protein [Tenebrionicola larvae]
MHQNKEKNHFKRVVVTGYGAVTPLGITAQESWQAIMDGRLGYRAVDYSAYNIQSRFFGLIDEEPGLKGVPAAIRRRLPRYARLTLGAARQAVAMAFGDGQPQDVYDPLACGVIMGTGWGGLDESNAGTKEFAATNISSPFNCFLTMPNVATAACSQFWNLRGYQNTAVAACATGNMVIGDAWEAIRNGRATMMLAGSGESLISHYAVWNIDVLGALCKEQEEITRASCPFSAGRNGFVLSEGAAVLCLEERESALARGATILGEVTGYANFSDAFDFTSPAEDCVARVQTIRQALQVAGLEPEQLDYINAHGTSTPLNDLNETQSLKMALGRAAYDIPVSSTKSYSGHLIAAAGSFESIICLQTMAHGIMPATANLSEPDPQCDLDYIAQGHRRGNIRRTLNMSFGFGGANAALVLEKHE